MTTNGSLATVLELLLTKAHRVVTIGLVVFFMGPTCLVGFLVWRMVDRQDRELDLVTTSLSQHMASSKRDLDQLQLTMQTFIETQHAVELQRNGLLYEICLGIANDGPGRSRCRMAIGQ